MRMVSVQVEQTQNKDVYQVGLGVDSGIYYAALVNVATSECYVEEVGISQRKMGFQGIYRKIDNDQEWKRIYAFFNTAGVFEDFFHGSNWYWSTMNGNSPIPPWFQTKHNKS